MKPKCCSYPTAKNVCLILLTQFIILCMLIQFNARIRNETQNAVKYFYRSTTFVNDNRVFTTLTTKDKDDNSLGLMSIEAANKERVERIRQYCASYKNKVIATYPNYTSYGESLTKWIWMISKQHKLFYCATPKCGSTTWKSYILEDLKVDIWTDTHVAAKKLGVDSVYKKSKLNMTRFLEMYRPANRLIIVRNPWARLVSAYDDKIGDKKWKLNQLCAGWKKYDNVRNVTFHHFVGCLLQKPETTLYEAHTHPLVSLCAVCHMDYNIILKLEELDQAEIFLKKRLNFTIVPNYKPPRKLKHNTYSDSYQNLKPQQIQQLQLIYRHDIELFGYPKTPFE